MSVRHRVSPGLLIVLALLLGLGAGTSPAQWTADPYQPYNWMYRPFVYPNFYRNPALPNQARLEAQAAPATGSAFFEALSGFDQSTFGFTPRTGGRGVPYYQAYRNQAAAAGGLSGPNDQTYVPNRGDSFAATQAERQRRFYEAMREPNPRRRSEMMRELEADRNHGGRADDPERPVARPDRGALGRPSAASPLPAAPSAPDNLGLMRAPMRAPVAVPTDSDPSPDRGGGAFPGARTPARRPISPDLLDLLDRPPSSGPRAPAPDF